MPNDEIEVLESLPTDAELVRDINIPAPAVDADVLIDIPSPETRVSEIRESAARALAEEIVRVFRWALLGSLTAGYVLIFTLTIFTVFRGWTFEKEWKVITKGVIPLLTAVATVTTTIFGPLLAFVLGYYFGEQKK